MGKYLTAKEKLVLRKKIFAFLRVGMKADYICNHLDISKDMLYRLRVKTDNPYARLHYSDYDPMWSQYDEQTFRLCGIKLYRGMWNFTNDLEGFVIYLYENGVKIPPIVSGLEGIISRATVYRIVKAYKEMKPKDKEEKYKALLEQCFERK